MKMATWTEINGKVGTNGSPLTKCLTMSEVLNADSRIHIKGDYSANKLVALDDVVALTENTIRFEARSSSRINWRSTYPLGSNITAVLDYRDLNGSLRSYSFLMSSGSSSALVDLSSPMREFAGININTRKDSVYYYLVSELI